mmetsp:Transcript_25414/g.63746  ORF Transcript_25414/g.63746 Transcript_25414/m.63746 type:complete len:266 (-) Transcript_25414:125-922(-)
MPPCLRTCTTPEATTRPRDQQHIAVWVAILGCPLWLSWAHPWLHSPPTLPCRVLLSQPLGTKTAYPSVPTGLLRHRRVARTSTMSPATKKRKRTTSTTSPATKKRPRATQSSCSTHRLSSRRLAPVSWPAFIWSLSARGRAQRQRPQRRRRRSQQSQDPVLVHGRRTPPCSNGRPLIGQRPSRDMHMHMDQSRSSTRNRRTAPPPTRHSARTTSVPPLCLSRWARRTAVRSCVTRIRTPMHGVVAMRTAPSCRWGPVTAALWAPS